MPARARLPPPRPTTPTAQPAAPLPAARRPSRPLHPPTRVSPQVAVLLPVAAAQAQVVGGPPAELALAAAFGAATLATTLNTFDAQLFNAALLTAQWDPEAVAGAAPGAAAFLGILGE